jgi:biotin carboxyl carrier protein
MTFESSIDDQVFEVSLNDDQSAATVNGHDLPYEIIRQKSGRILFRTGTKLYKIDNISIENRSVAFSINGQYVETTVKDEQELLLEKLGFDTVGAASAGQLDAPMPGKILDLLVAEGDEVEEGQPVIIL